MWRCLNDFFGYCKGEPEFKRKPHQNDPFIPLKEGEVTYLTEGTCKLDPATCGKYLTHSQLVPQPEAQPV